MLHDPMEKQVMIKDVSRLWQYINGRSPKEGNDTD